MRNRKVVSILTALFLLFQVAGVVPASAAVTAVCNEGFDADPGFTVSGGSGFSYGIESGFGAKTYSDGVYRVVKEQGETGGAITLTKTFDTPVDPTGKRFHLAMEVLKKEYGSSFQVSLIGNTSSENNVESSALIQFSPDSKIKLGSSQTNQQYLPSKWYLANINVSNTSDYTQSVYGYLNSAVVYSGVSPIYANGATSSGVFTLITGIKIKATSNQITGTSEYSAVDVAFDNLLFRTYVPGVDTGTFTGDLPVAPYIYAEGSSFEHIFTPDNLEFYSGNSDNQQYKAFSSASTLNAGKSTIQGIDKAKYEFEEGVFGKPVTDSSLHMYNNQMYAAGADYNPGFLMDFKGSEDNKGILAKGNQAHLSLSLAPQQSLGERYIYLYNRDPSGTMARITTGNGMFLRILNAGDLQIFGTAGTKRISFDKWNKFDFIITAGINDDVTKNQVVTYLNGEQLTTSPVLFNTAALMNKVCLLMYYYAQPLGEVTTINSTNCRSAGPNGWYIDDMYCAYYTGGAQPANPTATLSAVDDSLAVSASANTITMNSAGITVESFLSKLNSGGKPLKVYDPIGEPITTGVLRGGETLALQTVFGGDIYYQISPYSKNSIFDLTFDGDSIAANEAPAGWAKDKIGGAYTWNSSALESGAGGKTVGDKYYVLKTDGLTYSADQISGLTGVVSDPSINYFNSVTYDINTYEISFNVGCFDQFMQQKIFFNSTYVDALTYQYGVLKTKTGQIIGNITPGRWYKAAITLHKDGTADYYLNGDLAVSGEVFTTSTISSCPRIKIGMTAPVKNAAELPVKALSAFDNIEWYGSNYANTEDIITVNSSNFTVDNVNGVIVIGNNEFIEKYTLFTDLETNANYKIYTDNNLREENNDTYIDVGNVIVFSSQNGEVMKYYKVVNEQERPASIGEVQLVSTDTSVSVSVPVTTYNSEGLTLIIASYKGNTLKNISYDTLTGESPAGSYTLTSTLTKAADETAKVMLWSSFEQLKPIVEHLVR